MLDASLYYSFFSRRRDGKIIGLDSNLGWHSEENGVFMINQEFKQKESMQKQLHDYELSMITGEEDDFDNINLIEGLEDPNAQLEKKENIGKG